MAKLSFARWLPLCWLVLPGEPVGGSAGQNQLPVVPELDRKDGHWTPPDIYLSVCLPACLSIYLSACLPVYLSIYLSI
jgi:hypothetical protein